jgi:hypothetical protein
MTAPEILFLVFIGIWAVATVALAGLRVWSIAKGRPDVAG